MARICRYTPLDRLSWPQAAICHRGARLEKRSCASCSTKHALRSWKLGENDQKGSNTDPSPFKIHNKLTHDILPQSQQSEADCIIFDLEDR